MACANIESVISIKAEDGEVAISLIQQRQFKIIILDLNMPKKSGDQVLEFIRDRRIETKVIVISGEASINKVTEAVRLGAYDIFKKPYSFDELAHTGLHDGLHYALCYCGSGVSMASYLGMRMGQRLLGNRDGRTGFDNLPFPTRPLYSGSPWFLPAVVSWYRWRDRRECRSAQA